MQKIVLATNNIHKIKEFGYIVKNLPVELLPQSMFGVKEIEEHALTFVENALLKARNASQIANLPVLADDSGLTVDALNGRPGIYSARYAGEHANYVANNAKLLQELIDVPEDLRTARFHCILVYLRRYDDAAPIIGYGIWEGRILFKPVGEYGFGYDPIFFVPTHNCSAAELLPEVKNQISHRAQAVCKFKQFYAASICRCRVSKE